MAALNPRIVPWLAALFVVGCTLAAFLNSLDGEFLMDDFAEILDNPLMESPWPPWRVMFIGHELPSRPLPYLTFAIDHAIWGKQPFGYHLTNLVIHVVAALSLFFLTRTTLSSPRLRDTFGNHADILAGLITSLWAVHPLNTQAVTYIYQRLECLAAMLCFFSLAAFAGAVARNWNGRWLTASVLASAAAMLSKETAVALPLMIASYEWLFCTTHPPAGRRLRYYSALCSTWLVLGLQMVAQAGLYHHTGIFEGSPLDYFLTQPRVIFHYLRLAIWPTGFCFDLNWSILKNWSDIVPSLVCMVALGLTVAYGLVRRRTWAWPGVVFLLALAPSSSFLPLAAIAEEYRMYLALSAVVAMVVLGIHTAIQNWAPEGTPRTQLVRTFAGLSVAVLTLLVVLTQNRNKLYATPGGVWMETLEQGNGGTRSYWNIALACDEHDGFDSALQFADAVVGLKHDMAVYEHLASRRIRKGDPATAERYLKHGITVQADKIVAGDPVAVRSVAYLAWVLAVQGKVQESESLAAEHLDRIRSTLGDDHPWTCEIMAIRASGLLRAGDVAGAEKMARTAYEAHLQAKTKGGTHGTTAASFLVRILRERGLNDEAREIERSILQSKKD